MPSKRPFGVNPELLIVTLFMAFLMYWFFPLRLDQPPASPPPPRPSTAVITTIKPIAAPSPPPSSSFVDKNAMGASDLDVAPAVPTLAVRPRIAVVIDDMGVNIEQTRATIAMMPHAVAFAFLPYGKYSRPLAAKARADGHEILLHLPMQPQNPGEDPGPNSLVQGLSAEEMTTRLDASFAGLDSYIGVNNHMGSLLTADAAALTPVMQAVKTRGLFFLDSKTTVRSVACDVAAAMAVPCMARDVFLDNELTDSKIKRQLATLERVAARRGYAIAIGHPHDVTVKALAPWLETLDARGFDLVPVSTLLPPNPPMP